LSITVILSSVFCLGYLALLVISFRRRAQLGRLFRWVAAALVAALLMQVSYLLPPDAGLSAFPTPALAVLLTSVLLAAFTCESIAYLIQRGTRPVLALSVVWLTGLGVLTAQAGASAVIGQPGWYGRTLGQPGDTLGLVVLSGWLVLSAINLGYVFYSFSRAELPELANRVLFWVLVVPLLPLGAVMGSSGGAVLQEAGWGLMFVGLAGMLYGALSHRVFDIRRFMRAFVVTGVITLITAVFIMLALFIDRSLPDEVRFSRTVLALVAGAAAVLYLPVRAAATWLLGRAVGNPQNESTTAVRRFSDRVASVVELREVADITLDALRETLNVRGGMLLLANTASDGAIILEPMVSNSTPRPPSPAKLPRDNTLALELFQKRLPLLQYDLEFSRRFTTALPADLKQFFKQLKMAAYAPIMLREQAVGVLAAGAKVNDDPFYPTDLDLLATLANQTGVTLRNARLVTEMRRAGAEMKGLNENLLHTKERLENLDKVKTDFVTIASHELRTPLAQIRGYTDILEAMNEQGMLDTDQMNSMTTNLRKATDRLEKLIADMLDVSQLGLDAMDLRFAPTTIEAVLRMAIEPLSESVKQRKLQLTARGLRGLPQIQGDMQRLVQAFRNIVLNSVKYTPDGGRIDITANVQKHPERGEDEILVKIADTGIGIDPRNHDLIFEKFFRVADPGLHSTGTTKFMGAGPGLGLTIARGVVEGHGGRVWVESQGFDPERLPGSAFYVALPVTPPQDARRVIPFESLLASTSGSSPQDVVVR
jgi:signal transduction histidine kinase